MAAGKAVAGLGVLMAPETKWQILYRSLFALGFAIVGAIIWGFYSALVKLAGWGKNT